MILLKEIMTNPNTVDKSKPYKFTASWVGNGLITAPGNNTKDSKFLLYYYIKLYYFYFSINMARSSKINSTFIQL